MSKVIFVFCVFFLVFGVFAELFIQDSGFAGGEGTRDNPYLVETSEQLDNVRHHLSRHFRQTGDISLAAYSQGEGWVPIGSEVQPFTGSFDGNECAVINMVINSSSDFLGLFGVIEMGELENISLINVDINGNDYIGALAGRADVFTEISNCYASGSISGNSYIGGLVGQIMGDTSILQSAAYVEVRSEDSFAGGLIGMESEGNISLSYAEGNVEGKTSVGGLIGASMDTNSQVEYCRASGSVSGTTNVGGLIGHKNRGQCSNSYAEGSVNGALNVGGLIGNNEESTIQNTYAVGSVQGKKGVGGLIGKNSESTVNSSYYDYQTTKQSDTGKGTPKSTNEMKDQNTFLGWDFFKTWGIKKDTYPYLRNYSPRARFVADVTQGYDPLEVRFYVYSIGYVDSWQWDLGDENTSSLKNPVHIYEDYGIYTVSLEISGISGDDTYIREEYIIVDDAIFPRGTGAPDDPFLITTAEQINHIRNYPDAHFLQTVDVDLTEYSSQWQGWRPLFGWSEPFTGSYNGGGNRIMNLATGWDRSVASLFGVLEDADISNVKLEDVNILSRFSYAGGLAASVNGNTRITNCHVSGRVNGTLFAGGLVGLVTDTVFRNCFSSADVSGNNHHIGGLAGFAIDSTFIRCRAIGNISGISLVGGLTGELSGGSIIESYTTGTASGEVNIGGLTGGIDRLGVIENSYARGKVTGESKAGGLVGVLDTGTINHCYATGWVEGDEHTGGLVGKKEGGTVIHSFYNIETSGQTDTGKGTPISNMAMMQQGTFNSDDEQWDFIDTWAIHENVTYPYLQWVMTGEMYSAMVDHYSVPFPVKMGVSSEITLTIRNTGQNTWIPGQYVYLGAVGDQDDLVSPLYWRVGLEHNVSPGRFHTFIIPLEPEETGTFNTEWQMIYEGIAWFGEIFSREIEVFIYTNVENRYWQLFQ